MLLAYLSNDKTIVNREILISLMSLFKGHWYAVFLIFEKGKFGEEKTKDDCLQYVTEHSYPPILLEKVRKLLEVRDEQVALTEKNLVERFSSAVC